jgi:four helix bundle protein
MKDFKKLIVWQKSFELAKLSYMLTKKFPGEEKFGLVSQVNRSAVSIPVNIAEGSGRNTEGERRQFLGIALGSSFELETQLLLAKELGYAKEEELTNMLGLNDEVQKMLIALQSKMK